MRLAAAGRVTGGAGIWVVLGTGRVARWPCGATENAGVEIAGVDRTGGKCRSGKSRSR